MTSASARSLNEAVAHASAVLGADPRRAQREAEAILARAPRDPRALLVLGSARRRQGDIAGALAILRPLAEAWPQAAHTQYELGLCLAARGELPAAAAALRRAVAARRDLAEAWRALGDALFRMGDEAGAKAAFDQHDRAAVGDPALAPAAEAFYGGRIEEAETRLRQHLAARPGDAAGLRLMAEVRLRQGRYSDAQVLLEEALRLEPGHPGSRFALATALFHQQKAPDALPHVEALLALAPKEAAYRNLLAACLGLVGEFERVIEINAELLREFPRQPRIWLNQGHALRTVGRRDEAVEAYRRAATLSPGLGDAWWSLANLKVARLSPVDEDVMAAQLRRSDLGDEDRLHLSYALGKAMEDRGAWAPSFEHYAAGARARSALVPYDAQAESGLAQRSAALLTGRFFAERAEGGSDARDPIFIVGLPRSGSTLIEQILASHSAVEGVMELPDIGIIADGLLAARGGAREAYPALLAHLSPNERRSLGELYLERTRIHRKTGRPLFIDKMPNNFRHIGLIRLILPRASVIDARRHPLAAGFSAFKQHFNQGQAFSYDLGDIGRYYRDYAELMAAVDQAAPGWVCRVIYEDLVDDTEAQVRRLLDHVGLPFEEACLRFYENDRAVRTVSSEQVRRPIFRDGLEQWRNYEAWLDPLKVALGPALETWRT
jgi:tetratricopeptide (TPR) repeat protein